MKLVDVDFNTMNQDFPGQDQANRLVIIGSPQMIERSLNQHETVLLTDGTMQVIAIVVFDRKLNSWLAQPDWSTRQDVA